MSVLDRFPQAVGDEQKNRAEEYCQSGAVEIQNAAENELSAIVRTHSGRYRVTLGWSDGQPFDSSCTCSTHRQNGVCEHVLAAALCAESQGHLPEDTQPFAPKETMPRRGRNRSMAWLSASGELRRVDVDEPRRPVEHRPSLPSWKKQLATAREAVTAQTPPSPENWPAEREMLYIVDVAGSYEARSLVIRFACRDRRQSGEWSKPKTRGVSFPDASLLPNVDDRQIMALLKGAGGGHQYYYTCDPSFTVPTPMRRLVVQAMCRTGRVFICPDPDTEELQSLTWDEGGDWHLWLQGQREESTQQYVLSGWLRRGEDRMAVARPALVVAGGLAFHEGQVLSIEDHGELHWVPLLRQHRGILVPFAQADELLQELLSMPSLPRLDLPDELKVEEVCVTPKPRLRVRAPASGDLRPERLRAELSFDYDGATVRYDHPSNRPVFLGQRRRLIVRDDATEHAAIARLTKLGVREAPSQAETGKQFWFGQRHLPRLVRTLVDEGWHVEADGNVYRRAGAVRLRVSSGIDWFELRGDVDFGGRTARLPDLLAAIRRGDNMVRLDDGTYGIVPENWLKKYGLIANLGEQEGEFLKFAKSQAGLLDVLLASQPEATCDEVFERTRQEMRRFEGVQPADAPAGFIGELRPYQRDGLGWFEFLRRFGFGGCLADDMGLGKTVQVLALLEARRELRESERARNGHSQKTTPSLIVVPRSLVFNWIAEAARFAPKLRLLDHTGIERAHSGEPLMDYDVIITTYGTLRRDVEFLKDLPFDYIVLDEAQAVKNPNSESAKAVRLVRGEHRLVLSGTPVQNHLGDLWSIFDFLNPGLLGAASVFGGAQSLRNPDREIREILAKALRPFILRRTKEQVAQDLPPKIEQTIYCELEASQRKLYDELREYYRVSLLERVARDGLAKSQMHILEALLRLRQAALHPALLDESRIEEPSAKLDVLLPQLEEVIEEGHKALIFSQFTSMLAIVRQQLDKQGIAYEYLDGQTRDRAERVQRFQSDDKCKLFLISLKAGGLGLNLTAADYVFLLDPWWNPAVEAQAIDRTHRIGQTKQVYACRLIAKDTVEEKVLALQQTKRDLADAIISADNSLLRSLGKEELELLLS